MNILSLLVVVLGLCLFETISSIDNAIINAEVLGTMKPKARRWFLVYGLIIAVFLVRGLLPWLIVWVATPFGPIEALTATFSSDPAVLDAVEDSAPILLSGGGVFLIFLFFHWLFLEPKNFGIKGEKFFYQNGIWFYAVVSIILCVLVWMDIQIDPVMAFGSVVGSTAFFITHGFKQNAELAEKKLTTSGNLSDISKILYLEVIDATFSIDGVLGAFAFTMSVPLILLGNGLGAFVVREITIGNIDRIKKYVFLKNGAMYSILFLGIIMLLDSYGVEIPSYVSPAITFGVVGFFFWKSKVHAKKIPATN
ncbi:MAG: DUF475 domain-containing protein [Candidatus Gracilibacteria bacterium]|jgi:hypothetical protein